MEKAGGNLRPFFVDGASGRGIFVVDGVRSLVWLLLPAEEVHELTFIAIPKELQKVAQQLPGSPGEFGLIGFVHVRGLL